MSSKCKLCGNTRISEPHGAWPGVARCGGCGAVFGSGLEPQPGAAGLSKRDVRLPVGYTLSHDGANLVILRRWMGWKYIALAAFCVFWDGFFLYWCLDMAANGLPAAGIFLPVLYAAFGLAVTYYCIAGFLNFTRIKITPGELSLRHYPLPWPGNRVLQRQEIAQFFCLEDIVQTKVGPVATYRLYVLTPGGDRIKLVSGLDHPAEALFLEQQLESYLGIGDRPVDGELKTV
ncbi:MAG: hypothetical protein NDI60_00380 [Elusimicrobiales bacterium]|nr:hypothetical protein [Elusimicrobiales bacterium]